MVLHGLLNLPAELLLEITACLYAQPISKDEYRIKLLSPLSQTCRQMNACCDPWIFAKYHLCLQADPDQYHTHLIPLGAVDTHGCCSLDAVKARLLHFRSKAYFVKELILENFMEGWQEEEEEEEEEPKVFPDWFFPDCILLDVMDALKYANKVTSVEIMGKGGTLPLSLWDWMRTKNLTKLSVGPQMTPPPDAQMHPKVHKFRGYLHEETMTFLELIRPDTIKLVYDPSSRNNQPPIHMYKPSDFHTSHVRNIILDIGISREFDPPLFDFSGVPNTTVYGRFYQQIRAHRSHWKVATPETKPRLDHVFPEGLDSYDVASPRHERGTFVYRPVLGEVKADQKLKTEEFWDQTNRARYERAQVDRYRAATAWDP